SENSSRHIDQIETLGTGTEVTAPADDSGQFAVSTGMCCQRTPEPACADVQFLCTINPPRAHISAMFL
ncbi:MAG: hypothetical protein WBP11_00860, partial [Dokdonella sp.]